MKKRLLAVSAALCSMAMLLAGCGSNGGSDSGQKGSKTVITAFDTEPQNPLIPGNTNESGGNRPDSLIFAGLVSFDAKGKASNEVAQSIDGNANSTQYTVKLKPGWKFSDGTPVTSKSFTKAWSYVANVKNAQKCSSFFSTIQGYDDLQKAGGLKGDEQLSGLKDVDDTTFTVTMSKPDATFPIKVGYLAFAPLPESFYKNPKAFGNAPVGNGPYKLESWNHNTDITLVRNKLYKGNVKPKNDGVTFKIYTKVDSAYADVQAGNLDVLDTVPTADAKNFQTDTNVQAYNQPGSVIQMFTIPSNLPHFVSGTQEGTLRRQAISKAIDRQGIIKKVLNGTGTQPVDFTSPKTPGFSKDLKGKDNLVYNAAQAKELWAKADAISKDNDKFTISYNTDGGYKAIYDAMINSIKNTLGIDAAADPMPTFQEFRNAVDKRSIKGGFRSGWQPDYPSAENYLFQEYDSAAAHGNGSNDGDYSNQKFDALMDQAYAAPSTDAANAIYSQSQEILLNDMPAIPMYYDNAHGVASKGLKGLVADWENMPVYSQLHK
ncbi:ABC transporter substrate-binding protein [Bifidobacterium sp. ESL0728]|uniref:peptide ABC transporter substrate-binding protein n=1 Tax=Bifidobacterium sp. ESL0728 TaxID=2983220 RepID=UPI0023F79BE9|nr:ABC transporter substrate-binding protein [Bifidobacterium sp. ESL0728]WEV58478.1 ABC transporter substrate-binding protein [Bifidobacterium sp. ESL0728]